MVPSIDGKQLHFDNVGLYDALFVMQDVETKTLWHHITGEALYGSHVGRTLGPIGNLMQINVEQALAMNTATEIAISDRVYFAGGERFGTATGLGPGANLAAAESMPPPRQQARTAGPRINADMRLMNQFVSTLADEDLRLPRMDVGLGIWAGSARRYYPMESIREQGGAFIDAFDGKNMLVFIDLDTYTPTALFVDAAGATVEGKEIHFDNGSIFRSGMLFDRDGVGRSPDRPQQLFTRWYGFALTFPGAEIFGQ